MRLEDVLRPQGKFLLIGEAGPELLALKRAGWSGISVNPRGTWTKEGLPDEDYYGGITYLEAVVSADPHFIRTIEGFWVRPVTVREIFDQWGATRFGLICIADVMLARTAWYTEQIKVHMPDFYLLRDDGHNASLLSAAMGRGYGPIRLRYNRKLWMAG
jgi:hypothetical protein